MKRTYQTKSSGFTLIELLVVISIISLLMTILIPALQNARAQARQTLCSTRQKSVWQGLYYYDEKYGRLPNNNKPAMGLAGAANREQGDVPPGGWWYAHTDIDPIFSTKWGMNLYVAWAPGENPFGPWDGFWWAWQQSACKMFDPTNNFPNPEIAACPASRTGYPYDTGCETQRYSGHYGTLGSIIPDYPSAKDPWNVAGTYWTTTDLSRIDPLTAREMGMKIDNIKSSSSVALVFDSGEPNPSRASAKKPQGYFWYIPGYTGNSVNNGSYAILDNFMEDALKGRHPNKRVNIMFADGHGESVVADVFVDGFGTSQAMRDRDGALRWYENPNGTSLRDQ